MGMIFACQCSLGKLEFYAIFKRDILDLNPSPPPKNVYYKKMIFFYLVLSQVFVYKE